MSWIEPKTDWTIEDFFWYPDYNRIIGNLYYLKHISEELFSAYDLIDMGEEKNEDSYIYAGDMNAIEENLEIINRHTYNLDIGKKQFFFGNGKTPLYTEINRVESAILALHEQMKIHKKNLTRLPFALGDQKGIKV